METDRLAYFCAIVEAGSLTGAAELLGVSHSGLSKAMTLLQHELGMRLFVPRGRGLEVTEDGHDVYRKAKEILAGLNGLRARVAPASPTTRVGLDGPLAHAFSGPIAGAFTAGLEIGHVDAGELEARVRDRQLDFAFTIVPFPHSDVDHLKIASIEFASFARRDAFARTDPDKIPYVVPTSDLRDNPLSLKAKDGWNARLERLTPYRASSLAIALGMVVEGAAVIYIPCFLAAAVNRSLREESALVELALGKSRRAAERSTRDVFLVKRGAEEETPAMRRASGVVRTLLKSWAG